MKREIGWNKIKKNKGSLVTVGTFDGVHIGHQSIIRYLVKRARQRNTLSTAVSFDPHPRQVIQNTSVPLLTTIDERAEVLEHLGLDRFVVIPFTHEFAETEAETFVVDVLVNRIGLEEIVIGYDHGFGKGREGDKELLVKLGRVHGFSVDVIPVKLMESDVISSTRIRQVLTDTGHVELATKMLGRYYSINGTVVRGDGRGDLLGYPTANIHLDNPDKIIPQKGVYAVWVRINDDPQTYRGMLNVGNRPTFDGIDDRMEVHIIGYEGNLYGARIRIEFVRRIRDEKKFSTVDDLVQQLSKDKERCIAELKSVT